MAIYYTIPCVSPSLLCSPLSLSSISSSIVLAIPILSTFSFWVIFVDVERTLARPQETNHSWYSGCSIPNKESVFIQLVPFNILDSLETIILSVDKDSEISCIGFENIPESGCIFIDCDSRGQQSLGSFLTRCFCVQHHSLIKYFEAFYSMSLDPPPPLHTLLINERPPRTRVRTFVGLVFCVVFNLACLTINCSQFIFLLPLRILPFSEPRKLYYAGIRYTKGAFGCLQSK